jgi:hypothetical protein
MIKRFTVTTMLNENDSRILIQSRCCLRGSLTHTEINNYKKMEAI